MSADNAVQPDPYSASSDRCPSTSPVPTVSGATAWDRLYGVSGPAVDLTALTRVVLPTRRVRDHEHRRAISAATAATSATPLGGYPAGYGASDARAASDYRATGSGPHSIDRR
jgi:hypothetical protein